MMSVSRQTQTWSKNSQESPLSTDKSENLSPEDKQKFYNGEDVGEVLNKAADPNWVDPDKKPRTVGNPTLDKDAFLKLLLTQMKNQDPTNPLKSHEMAAQLAQFTSLEKLTNIDESIKGLRKETQPTQNYEALNLIGKTVAGDSSRVLRTDPSETHAIRFQLKGDATKTKIAIQDEEGKTVRTLEFNNLKAGKNDVSWNGQLDDGTPARPGEYHLSIEATNAGGKKVWSETRFSGVIDGLTFTPQGPLLQVGKQQIRMSDVEKIMETEKMPAGPGVSLEAQPTPAPAAASAPKPTTATPTPPAQQLAKAIQETKTQNFNNAKSGLNQVGLSGGLMNDLKKQGAL